MKFTNRVTFLIIVVALAFASSTYLIYGYADNPTTSSIVRGHGNIPAPIPAPVEEKSDKENKLHDDFINIPANKLSYNPSTFLSQASPFANGLLAYTGYSTQTVIKTKSPWSPYVFVQGITNGKVSQESIATPQTPPFWDVFDPLISPDGKYIAFKYGWPNDSTGRFEECIWDWQNNKYLKPIPKFLSKDRDYLSYRRLFWSPNSKYIAYIRGGDQDGIYFSQSIKLYIHNVQTGKESFVAQNPYATRMRWTSKNSLLYCTIPESEIVEISPHHGKIYEASIAAQSVSSKLLIKGGFDPRPSPDGKYIIYFGWTQDDSKNINETKGTSHAKKDFSQGQVGLFIYDCDTGKKSLLLSPYSPYRFIDLLWKPDSNGIVLLDFASRSPHARVNVSEVNIKTKKLRRIKTLTVDDYKYISRPPAAPQIKPLSITRDGKFLIFIRSVYTGLNVKDNELIGKVSLGALNLTNGEVTYGAEMTNFSGIDYLPMSK